MILVKNLWVYFFRRKLTEEVLLVEKSDKFYTIIVITVPSQTFFRLGHRCLFLYCPNRRVSYFSSGVDRWRRRDGIGVEPTL